MVPVLEAKPKSEFTKGVKRDLDLDPVEFEPQSSNPISIDHKSEINHDVKQTIC